MHSNPREARVCSECGSNDLTTPQPKLPFLLRLALATLDVVPGVALLLVSVIFFIADLYVLVKRPDLQFRYMLFGLVLGLVWLGYMDLMNALRHKLHRRIRNLFSRADD